MKLTAYKYKIIFLFTAMVLLNSCIENNIAPPLNGDLDPVAEMLVYFEEQGDFVNSPDAPALINAEDVYNNLSSYLIVDIRIPAEFTDGHIAGSVNVQTDSLYNYFEKLNTTLYNKIVLVSKNGQSSAYFTCLLRLAGFNNVYTMNFGLASWNGYFADEWFGVIGNDSGYHSSTTAPVKNNFTPLPEVTFSNPNASIEKRLKERIKKIISEGFNEQIQYRKDYSLSVNDYFVCYGITQLYFASGLGQGSFPLSVLYLSDPAYDLRAVKFLQTMPTGRTIFLYDETGQTGACATAYLRLLGYDAVMLLFGGNQLIYYSMFNYTELIPFTFDMSDIMNYPYVTGN